MLHDHDASAWRDNLLAKLALMEKKFFSSKRPTCIFMFGKYKKKTEICQELIGTIIKGLPVAESE